MLGKRQLAAFEAAPAASVASAERWWRKSRPTESSKYPAPSSEQAVLLILAGVAVSPRRSPVGRMYPCWPYIERLRAAAPSITVRSDSGSRRFLVLLVEGYVVLRLKRESSGGVILARQPSGLPPLSREETPHIETPVPGPYLSLPQLPFESAGEGTFEVRTIPGDLISAARQIAELFQASIDTGDGGAGHEAAGSEGWKELPRRMLIGASDSEAGLSPEDHFLSSPPEDARDVLKEQFFPVLKAKPGCSMADADFGSASMHGASLPGALLLGSKLDGALFSGCDLREANFGYSDLRKTVFRRCDLSRAGFRKLRTVASTSFIHSRLRSADMRGMRVNGTKMMGCDLRGADLRSTDWRGLRSVYDLSLCDADIGGADFRGATLKKCDLRGVRGLADAALEACDLRDSLIDREARVIASLKGARIPEES